MRPLLPRVTAVAALLAPAAAFAGGSVTVRSDVPGQTIFLDGVDIGLSTPATIPGIPAGPHVLTVMGSCRLGETTVNVMEGRDLPLTVRTRETPGSVALQVSPAGADVRIDGALVQAAAGEPVPVACGTHTIGVSIAEHLPMMLNIEVEPGQAVTLPITLTRLGKGTLVLDVTPDKARVLLDGVEVGEGDLAGQGLVAGPHMLRIEATGFTPSERQFVLADKETLQLDVALEADGSAVAVTGPGPGGGGGRTGGGAGWSKGRITGVSLTGLGVGVGVLAGVQLARMVEMGREYNDRADEVLATDDASVLPAAYANSYRDEELLPQRNRAVTSTVLATVLLGTGISLTVAF